MKVIELCRLYGVSPTYLEGYREIYQMKPYLDPRQYKNACRYKNVRSVEDDVTKKIYHENWIQKFIDESKEDEYITVDISTENRLDIISYNYYNTPNFWWVIAIANNIIDPFDVPIGTYLRIPAITSLYNEGGILSGD